MSVAEAENKGLKTGGVGGNLDTSESIEVTVAPAPSYGANVFSVQVKIDDREPGGSNARVSPRAFALQKTTAPEK